jgi:hypothetical protein
MSQYLWYTFDKSSTTITNYGGGGSGYNGSAARNQYAVSSVNHPIWGPLNAATDVITIPSGISNPVQHTWQIGLRINRWWPVNGVIGGVLCGNDGKLWSAAGDTHYGYLHEECMWDGSTLTQTGIYHFSVEIQGSGGYSDDSVQFYLGVGNNKPTKISTNGDVGNEGGRTWWDFDYNLQLNTNYYFQVSVNLDPGSWASGTDYSICNCTGPGCNDSSNCGGFPCGCYLYSWREDNTVLDLSQGGNWAQDLPLWAGGNGPTPGPTPTPSPSAPPSVKLQATVRVQEWQPRII